MRVSMRYCHLKTSLFFMYLNHISHPHRHFFFFFFLMSAGIFFIITVAVSVVTIVLYVAYWPVDQQGQIA